MTTVTVFSSYPFECPYLTVAAQNRYTFNFVDVALTLETAAQAVGSSAVAVFVNDDASRPVFAKLWELGVRYLPVRAASHDNVGLPAAHQLGLRVATVPHLALGHCRAQPGPDAGPQPPAASGPAKRSW